MIENSCLFEISWEVCNKVGGIHTVISSKIRSLMESKSKNAVKSFSDYYVVGPYLGEDNHEFNQLAVPENFLVKFRELETMGIKVHYGEWNVSSKPKAILVDHRGYTVHADEIKQKLWDLYEIDSLNSDWFDYGDVTVWAWTCGVVIEKLKDVLCKEIIVHSHEWIAGSSILYLKSINSSCKTVFTTHATMLGRALSGSGQKLYQLIKEENVDWNQKAYEVGVHTKHHTERALALYSDCFTTVSNITGREAELFYGKKPDILLYNGFNNPKFTTEELRKSREETINFLKAYFHNFGGLRDDAYVLFTSGRYEIHNKGIDILVESLSKLNADLKERNSEKEVVVLFLVMLGKFEKDSLVLESISDYGQGKPVANRDYAPLSTHTLETNNEIIRLFLDNGLYNNRKDNVKVIFLPSLLDGGDDFLHRQYYDVTKGLDLGIFPSYYEPWGYTPLEALSYGVPALTTDLSGFGRYVKENNLSNSALRTLKREGRDDSEVAEKLFESLCVFLNKSEKERLNQKSDARELALKCDWKVFYQNYIKAYEIAKSK